MSFLKHVGKQGDRKVAIIFREIPGEPHMCLVTYTETLNQHIHDPLIRCIESDIGQNSQSLADALNRTLGLDGRPILQTLHAEGLLKKVQTEMVVVTPNPQSKVKLSELNKILTEMEKGEEAVKRLSDIDKQAGMQTKKRQTREVGMPPNNTSVSRTNIDVDATDNAAAYIKGTLSEGVLSDSDIAAQRLTQAEAMQKQAMSLLAEAQRLTEEAKSLTPAKNAKTTRAKKATPPKKQAA